MRLLIISLLSSLFVIQASPTEKPSSTAANPLDNQAFLNEYDLFESEEPLKVELKFDYRRFIKEKYKDKYQEADLTVFFSEDHVVEGKIRMRARGEFRRRYCSFPPIKLNFKKSNFDVPALKELETLKLVNNCKNQADFQQYIFKERLAYKMYNQITPISFKVRLLEITYIDSRGKKKPFTRYGFVIEDVDDVAERNECIKLSVEKTGDRYVDRDQMTLIYIFEYMIGNTDYALGNMHNVKLVQSKNLKAAQYFVVPYDFDYSGLVNTSYAVPHPDLGIEKVTERVYRGYCRKQEEVDAAVALFQEKEETMINLVKNDPYLSKRHRGHMEQYLEDFYMILQNKREVRELFVNGGCRTYSRR